ICYLFITGCSASKDISSAGYALGHRADYEVGAMAYDNSMEGVELEESVRKPVNEQSGTPKNSTKRMVYYQGYLKMLVAQPTKVIDQARALASEHGGYVERLDTMSITIRIPVAKFDLVFKKAMELGDVMKKSINASDITQSFQDDELRLKIARATRERLVELLAKATEEEEKLKILKEIQRLSEEIEQFETRLRILSGLANYSKLTIELEKRHGFTERETKDIAEFSWIKKLSPFRAADLGYRGRLEMIVPANMVLLGKKGQWTVESADGAVMRSGWIANKPSGDSDFWIEAVRLRLAAEFSKVEVQTIGEFKVLRMVDRSDEPYIYLVGISADQTKNTMKLIEVYFPSRSHEERYGKSVQASIAGGEK
ncbi:MAG: DUF4349 domain-containing protein, partial [Desulfobulbaceae bacterium]|nr:DUF4349 domain-containing protein [Desulfobulbaceae bacterium]